eukprot:Cvel_17030.t2-p1 / transcript=Cvel_17030.t2 / gene=Cvel_17030 / organism=Chromera_velia_CCMP2878 / gene_product=hypothetical protein / transcript_product=hypothetical protein / location=Cvel_scaffold1339:46313-47453(-) / protein_length=254 / sequence_SO=supercontig / SO=protein_coding / is_pseudo=false
MNQKEKHVDVNALKEAEFVCSLTTLVSLLFFHAAHFIGADLGANPNLHVRLVSLGTSATYQKLVLSSFHFSKRHYWILSLTDTGLFVGNALHHVGRDFLLPGLACLVFFPVSGYLLDRLRTRSYFDSLGDADALRSTAEETLKRFISYIMHEIRGPLSGTTLLAGDFHLSLQTLLQHELTEEEAAPGPRTESETVERHRKIKAQIARMVELTRLMRPQLDKMRGWLHQTIHFRDGEFFPLDWFVVSLHVARTAT